MRILFLLLFFFFYSVAGITEENNFPYNHISRLLDQIDKKTQEVKKDIAFFLDGWEVVCGDSLRDWVFEGDQEVDIERDEKKAEKLIIEEDDFYALNEKIRHIKSDDTKTTLKKLSRVKRKIQSRVKKLSNQRQLLSVLLRRTEKNLYNSLVETYENNFANLALPLRAQDVYSFLGFHSQNTACVKYKVVKRRIEKIKRGNFKHIDKKRLQEINALPKREQQMVARQISFLFGNYLSKQEFDTFLSGEKRIAALCIDQSFQQEIIDTIQYIVQCRELLKESKGIINEKVATLKKKEHDWLWLSTLLKMHFG